MNNKVVKEILEWIVCFIIAYVIYLVINYFLGTVAGVKQSSMYPTAKEGERVVISRRIFFNKILSRGDIITVEAPVIYKSDDQDIQARYINKKGISWFTYKIMGIGKRSYIKRIIALEGEHLYISEDAEVYINDEKLEEPYLSDSVATPRTGPHYDIVVPQGHIFVMGDNREGSMDSREFGTIPISKVEGKALIRIWPLNKIGKIKGES